MARDGLTDADVLAPLVQHVYARSMLPRLSVRFGPRGLAEGPALVFDGQREFAPLLFAMVSLIEARGAGGDTAVGVIGAGVSPLGHAGPIQNFPEPAAR